MWIGHTAPAFLAKPFLPHTSLAALVLATCLADGIAFTFATLGIEVFRFNPAKSGALPYDFLMPYTHSMTGMGTAGIAYALAYTLILRNEKVGSVRGPPMQWLKLIGWIVGLTLTHWFFEVPVHRVILDGVTVFMDDKVKYGMGLFDNQLMENVLELGLFIPTVMFYASQTRPKADADAQPWYGRLSGLVVLGIFSQLMVCAAPRFVYAMTPDKVMSVLAVLQLAMVTFTAYQVDAHREVVSTTATGARIKAA